MPTPLTISSQAMPTFEAPLSCLGNQTLTVDATAGGAGLTLPSTASPARLAVCQLEVGQVRFWTNPSPVAVSATVGRLLDVGSQVVVAAADLTTFRAIRTGGTSG